MMDKNLEQRDLGSLLSAICDGSITPDQLAVLEQALQTDRQARQFYLEYLDLHASLILSHHRVASVAEVQDPEAIIAENDISTLRKNVEIVRVITEEQARIEGLSIERLLELQRERNRKPESEPITISWKSICAAVASVAAMLILLISWMVPGPVSQQPVFVARIVGASNPVWTNEDAAIPLETNLQQGQVLDLLAGLLEIEFGDGTRMILEGPAHFTVKSRDTGDLQLGKLVARVPDQAHGFRIQTPGVNIVDLGTEFGVVVDTDHKSQVRVFAGLVSLQAVNREKQEIESRLLQPGTTIEVASASATSLRDAEDESVFKKIAVIPKLSRTLIARNQKIFIDDFSNVPSERYSMSDNYGRGGAFDFEQGNINLRPATSNTMAVMLTEPGLRLQRGDQFSVDISGNKSAKSRVGLMISTLSGQPNGTASFGFRFSFLDQHIWVQVYEQPSDDRPGYAGKGPGTTIHKLPEGDLKLSVEWVGDTTFKFYCQSSGSPNRLLIDTRSIKMIDDYSELYVGVQCFRSQDPLVVQCSRLTIGPIETLVSAEQARD